MKQVELLVRTDLFEKIGVQTNQIYWVIDEKKDLQINGSVTVNGEFPENIVLTMKANLCDPKGNIMYILRDFRSINFLHINYDTFSISCSDVSRFFDINKFHHIELYPCIKRDSRDEN